MLSIFKKSILRLQPKKKKTHNTNSFVVRVLFSVLFPEHFPVTQNMKKVKDKNFSEDKTNQKKEKR